MRRGIVAIAVLLAASVCAAQEKSERTFSLKASAAAECPAIETFSRRVLARTSRAALASTGKADVAFVLSVEVGAEGASGTLQVVEGEARSRRSVRGASCEEVVDALALIAAVTLDPEASTEPIAISPATAPAAPEPAKATPTARVPASVPPPPRPSERAAPGPSWRLGAGVRGMLTQGLAPDPLIGIGVFASALLPGEGSIFEPTVLVGAWLARSGEFDATNGGERLGSARFRWLAGDIMGCPLRLPADGTFAARPCVGFEAGQLTGEGQAAVNSAEESATWLAMTANLKLDWVLFERLQIDLVAGGFIPLTRDEFFFEPTPGSPDGVVVHEVPLVGLRAWIGLSAVFP